MAESKDSSDLGEGSRPQSRKERGIWTKKELKERRKRPLRGKVLSGEE